MTKADKRAKKRENQAKARAAYAAARRRQSRVSNVKRLGGIIITIAVIAGVFLLFTQDDDKTIDTSDSSATTIAPISTTTVALPEGCTDTVPGTQGNGKQYEEAGDAKLDPTMFYTATIATSCGDIIVALDVAASPIGVNNFVFLAREGFYDGLSWHRAVTGFVIQGGDPDGTGSGGPGYSAATETPTDGYVTGDLAWAKGSADAKGTAGSQFFVVTGDPAALNSTKDAEGKYDYGYFGKVISGLENAKTIESLSPGDGPPVLPVYILKVTIAETDTPPTTSASTTTAAPPTTVPATTVPADATTTT